MNFRTALVSALGLSALSISALACAAPTEPEPMNDEAPVRTPSSTEDTKGAEATSGTATPGTSLTPAPGAAPVQGAPSDLRVFVTSAKYSGNLFGEATSRGAVITRTDGYASWTKASSDAADYLCKTHADAAKLGGTWRAYVSTTEGPDVKALRAMDRIKGEGPWKRIDGALAFSGKAAFLVGASVALDLNEFGSKIATNDDGVWTSTGANGTPAGFMDTCEAWNSSERYRKPFIGSSYLMRGAYARASISGQTWQYQDVGSCDSSHRLYCFEER